MLKLFLPLLLLLAASSSHAGLGAHRANFGAHEVSSSAKVKVTRAATYTILERALDSGIVIREYLDADSLVFATSWSGPYQPNLRKLLGTYFNRYVSQAAQARGTGSHVVISDDDLVVQNEGHMGSFEGRAWIPSKLPPGFDPANIE
jgi:S1-C subfamily serine protease